MSMITDKDKYIGKKFGKLLIKDLKQFDRKNHRRVYALCVCECGNEKWTRLDGIQRGATTSCGCYQKKLNVERANKMRKKVRFFKGTSIGTIKNNEPTKINSTGVRGVHFCKSENVNRYMARIGIQGERLYLGIYKTLAEAKAAREKAEEKYYQPIIESFEEK